MLHNLHVYVCFILEHLIVTLIRFVLLVLSFNFVIHCIISSVVVAFEIKLSHLMRTQLSSEDDLTLQTSCCWDWHVSAHDDMSQRCGMWQDRHSDRQTHRHTDSWQLTADMSYLWILCRVRRRTLSLDWRQRPDDLLGLGTDCRERGRHSAWRGRSANRSHVARNSLRNDLQTQTRVTWRVTSPVSPLLSAHAT